MKRIHHDLWQLPKAHYQYHREDDALSCAQRMAALRDEITVVVEVRGLMDGPHLYTGHDAMTYGAALAANVEPRNIVRWVQPQARPRLTTAELLRRYSRDLDAQAERLAVA